ncbi:Sodium/glucose cotransporter 2 [Labeo rohita]|uniref:Sodium/glucose cotransporter 2 n=1 Tax=Labeo rohita TaxID=84645 RepID=A0ABQ8LJK7_LABRO|nr:Sodium/glucose cotransporter 2 [Labeo rohita]
MATSEKKRSAFFSPAELDVLMQSYSKYEHIFKKKKQHHCIGETETAWENIAAQCSFSFDVSSANRKKAEARKTGGGPAPPPLTNAEEMALSLNTGRPVAEGIPAGCSSEPVTPQHTNSDGNICLLEPPVLTEPQAVSVEEQEEEEEGPSTSSAQMNTVQ